MGTSKVIFLSGLYMILGFYTVSFRSTDETNFANALGNSTIAQIDQIAKTGISLALMTMGGDSSASTISQRKVSVLGGSVTISANRPVSLPLSQSQVIATGEMNGRQIQTTAVVQFHGGRWKVLKVYSQTLS